MNLFERTSSKKHGKTPKKHLALVKRLKADPKVRDPEALAAWIGRRVRKKGKKGKKRKLRESTEHGSLFDRVVGSE